MEEVRKEINIINGKITVLKDEYTEELNTVNYYFWPIIAKEKTRRKNLRWYFTLSCCLLFSAVILLIIFEIKNEYFIAFVLGLSLLIFGLTLFFLIRCNKRYKLINSEWEKSLKPSEKQKEELTKMIDEVKAKMADYLEIENNLSYEELLQVYYEKEE